jgi:undecaprenyl pyrophosphate synthase
VNLTGPVYRLYEYFLHKQLHKDRAPRHVGIILDGNRRYARQHGLDVGELPTKTG